MVNRVLHIVRNFSPPSQTFIYDLIKSLEDRFSDQQQLIAYYDKRLLAKQRDCRDVRSIAKRRDLLGRFLRVLKHRGSVTEERSDYLRKLILEFRPDVIHAHFAWSVWDVLIPFFNGDRLEVPVVVSVHGTDILQTAKQDSAKQEALVNFYQRYRVRFAVANRFMANELIGLGISESSINIVVNTPSGAFVGAPARGSLSRVKVPPNPHSLKLVCVGRLINMKGQEYLIEALHRLIFESRIDCELTLIGDGPDRAKIGGLVERLGLKDRVHLMGVVDHEIIPVILSAQDLYIQPSIFLEETGQCEAFGLSVLEAISCGLPVVVTRSGGMPDVVGEENAYVRIVEPADIDSLHDAIRDLYLRKAHELDNSSYARERLGFFSREYQLSSLQQCYNSIASR